MSKPQISDSPYLPSGISRRTLLRGAGAAALAGPALAFAADAEARAGSLFTLGVASGDPTAVSVVLWTRLAPDPLNGGGLGRAPVAVRWAVAADPHMRHVLRGGLTWALAENGHAVHVVAGGLPSDAWLYYRFYARGQASRVGRTRTFPGSRDGALRMRFAVANCQNYTGGFHTAYRDMAEQPLDFVVHVGDYMYEGGQQVNPILSSRNHNGPETFTVDEYRNR